MSYTLAELAIRTGAELEGDKNYAINGVASLGSAQTDEIGFYCNPRLSKDLKQCSAGAVILSRRHSDLFHGHRLISENPYATFAKIASLFAPSHHFRPRIHPTAVVHTDAEVDPSAFVGANSVIAANVQIGANVYISSNCSIEFGVHIGSDTHVHNNVAIYAACIIGARCILHAGSVIGSDGFGVANDSGTWIRFPQTGSVVIGDDVDVGANTTIDRGALDNTIIGNGVKMDNQVHIGHNVRIGDHTAMAGCVAVAGSVTIGRRCMLGGSVNIVGHIDVADDVQIAATSFVTRSISSAGLYSSAVSAQEVKVWRRNAARLHRLDALANRVFELEKLLEELKLRNG